MSVQSAAVAVMAGCILAGVSCAASGPALAQPTNDQSWSVTFRMSGGLAGLDRGLEVSSSGAATATDRIRRQRETGQVPRDDLTALGRLVAAATSIDVARPDSCRDCFEYDIDITSPGRHVTVHGNDVSLSSSNAAPLITMLRRLQDRLLSGQRGV
jgi:hypothetical protein